MNCRARISLRSLRVSSALLALVLTALALAGLLAAGACSKAAPTAPSGSTLVLSVSPAAIVSSTGSATATASLHLPDGLAQPGAQVQFTTTLGDLNPSLATTNNNGIATATLTGNGRVGTATVMAFSGAVMSSNFDVTIGSTGGSITVQAVPASIPSSGGRISLVAIVRDATGAPEAGASVNFTANLGRLASGGGVVITNSSGEATDTLVVQAADVGNATTITVGADTGGAMGALLPATPVTINIITNAAATIIVFANPQVLPQTGGMVTLTALVRNSSGNPVAGAGVSFSTNLGTVQSGGGIISTGANGQAMDTLTITGQTAPTTATVTASTPGPGNALINSTVVVTIGNTSQ
jgi:adhesin/invasin